MTPSVHVACPTCEAVVEVPIDVQIVGEWPSQVIVTEPDLTDVWAHAWTHWEA